jgi:hypothetical protein
VRFGTVSDFIASLGLFVSVLLLLLVYFVIIDDPVYQFTTYIA